MILLQPPNRHRERLRLLAVIRLAEQHGWRLTLEHAQEQLYRLESGRIERAF